MSDSKHLGVLAGEVVAAGYDALAREYAARLSAELEGKPFDRTFLKRFAALAPAGTLLDLGCGPGHVAQYLLGLGRAVRGFDLSAKMVEIAAELHRDIVFDQGDMRRLPYPSHAFAGIAAFYSIIHLNRAELAGAFSEMRRVLQPRGVVALAFHVGSKVVHLDELWGIKTSLDFAFFEPQEVAQELESAGLEIADQFVRPPYAPEVEAQTERCYMFAIPRASGAA